MCPRNKPNADKGKTDIADNATGGSPSLEGCVRERQGCFFSNNSTTRMNTGFIAPTRRPHFVGDISPADYGVDSFDAYDLAALEWVHKGIQPPQDALPAVEEALARLGLEKPAA